MKHNCKQSRQIHQRQGHGKPMRPSAVFSLSSCFSLPVTLVHSGQGFQTLCWVPTGSVHQGIEMSLPQKGHSCWLPTSRNAKHQQHQCHQCGQEHFRKEQQQPWWHDLRGQPVGHSCRQREVGVLQPPDSRHAQICFLRQQQHVSPSSAQLKHIQLPSSSPSTHHSPLPKKQSCKQRATLGKRRQRPTMTPHLH